ncbi:MAG: hypothetical protein NTY03_03935 [Candidatus Bathyarchaeota archaeon]|nr:hypothetical protein [Candidatus Bathyarchaeota archaeon]
MNQHREAHLSKLPSSSHKSSPPATPLSDTVVEPGHGSVVPDVNHRRLNHSPPKPPRSFTSDSPVPLHPTAAPRAWHKASVAGEVVTAAEAPDVADLRLHQQGDVVAHPGYRHEELDIIILPGATFQVPGDQLDLFLQWLDEPEVAVHRLELEAAEPLDSLRGEESMACGRLDALVGQDVSDLHLELRHLPDHGGSPTHLLPDRRDLPRGYVARGQAVQPQQLS